MSDTITSAAIALLHHNRLHELNIDPVTHSFFKLVDENHFFNHQLWLAEDRARRDDKGFEFVYKAKREIDSHNQQRNNRMEAMDAWLFASLEPSDDEACMLHSETPGMMIDRLSILSLKYYHMELQTKRTNVDDAHRQTCSHKLQIIKLQLQQLSQCFDQFIQEILEKKRTFRVYHQFKMYNDPKLNPELY